MRVKKTLEVDVELFAYEGTSWGKKGLSADINRSGSISGIILKNAWLSFVCTA